jgi:hypothetical protein
MRQLDDVFENPIIALVAFVNAGNPALDVYPDAIVA